MFETDLANEFVRVASEMKLTPEELKTCTLNAIRASWLDESEKRDLLSGVLANAEIDLEIRPGEIHALLGENASLDFLGPDVTAAHCTQLDHDDIRILAETGTKIGHCPCCNAKLVSGTIPLKAVREAGVTVGLATDGPASHNALDMFQEMKFAGLIHKATTNDPEFLRTAEILEMATAGGAAAMNRPETGTLAPGKAADVIIVDLDKPHALPVYDADAALVYSSRADDCAPRSSPAAS